MTDDRTDDLLRKAGERWRDAQPPAPEIDPSRLTTRRRWIPVAAAAGLVLAIGGTAVVLATSAGRTAVGGSTGQVSTPPVPTSGPRTADRLIVRDGDQVEATGKMIIEPNGSARMCFGADFAIKLPPETAEPCGFPVRLIGGLDQTAVADRREQGGATVGRAVVRGIWTDRAIEIREQVVLPDPPTGPAFTTGSGMPTCDPCGPPPTSTVPDPKIAERLEALSGDRDNGILAWSPSEPAFLELAVLTERVHGLLASEIDLSRVELRASIVPIR